MGRREAPLWLSGGHFNGDAANASRWRHAARQDARRLVAVIAIAEGHSRPDANEAPCSDVPHSAADHEFQRSMLDDEHGFGALVGAGGDLDLRGDGVGMGPVAEVGAVGVGDENDPVASEKEGFGHRDPHCSSPASTG